MTGAGAVPGIEAHIFFFSAHTFYMEERKQFWLTGMKYTGIALGVYAVIRWLLPYVIPFLTALLLAKWLYPAVRRIYRGRRLAGSLLLILVFSGFACALVLGVYGLSVPVQRLIDNREELTRQCMEFWRQCCDRIEEVFHVRLDGILLFWEERLGGLKEKLEQKALTALMGWSAKSLRYILSWCGAAIVVVAASFYMLHDYEEIRGRAARSPWGSFLVQLGRKILGTLGIYLRTQLVIISAVSAVCVGALWLCKNPYAIVIGILIGVCDALPFLGTGTVFVPWALIDLLMGKYWLACVYAGLYAVCTFVRELLEPRLMGKKLDMHPVAVMMSIYIGLCVYGIPGVLLGPVSFILMKEIGEKIL